MDTVDKATRSKIMSRIGPKNTGPEVVLRKSLHRLGLRYRLHDKQLPGKPDIVFPKFKAVVFVHGCFWHRHGCKLSSMPSTNVDYWRNKFKQNTARDKRHSKALQAAGWRVAVVWECALKGKSKGKSKGKDRGTDADQVAKQVRTWLHTKSASYTVSKSPKQ
ncbi:MAG: very short patch repair endonuclease [Pseudomonadales bacterium]